MALPQTGPVSDIMIGTLFINSPRGGWSEKYYLPPPEGFGSDVLTYAGAAGNLERICQYRAAMLGLGCQIDWARVSRANAKRESAAGITSPQLPLALLDEDPIEAINDPSDALMYRFEDGAGRFSSRMFRGVRDSWIEDVAPTFVVADTIPAAGDVITYPPVTNTLTPATAIKNFLGTLMQTTCFAEPDETLPGVWNTFPINFIIFRGVRNRDTGRPFGLSRGRAPSRI